MKTFAYIFTVFLFCFSTNLAAQVPAENQWMDVSLTGKSFKILKNFDSHFFIKLTTGKSFSAADNRFYNNIEVHNIQDVLFQNENALQGLFQVFNGEFHISPLSFEGQAVKDIEAVESWNFGLALTYKLSDKFGVDVGFNRYETSISGRFPILIFLPQTNQFIESEGQLKTTFNSRRIHLAAEYYFKPGALQPFASLGFIYESSAETNTQAMIDVVKFSIEEIPATQSLNPFGKIGVATVYKKLRANVSFLTWRNKKEQTLGFGFEFGLGILIF